MAEVIENNLRKVIIEESVANPRYYEKMSTLLDELIKRKKAETIEYEKYLKELAQLSTKVKNPAQGNGYPATIDTTTKRNIYDNIGKNEALALSLDAKILTTKKDNWRDHPQRAKAVRNGIRDVLAQYGITDENECQRIYDLVKKQREY
jgi:type I restriction enzyme R subunit